MAVSLVVWAGACGGPAAAVGFGLIVICRAPLALQPGDVVTVTLSVTGLVVPAVNVMLGVPCPLVMVPFVIVQA